jgi:uncharacterized protein (DUF4415 family)
MKEREDEDRQRSTAEPETERVWLKLDREVVAHFRSKGRKWHHHANDVLTRYVREQE